jgi:hypothetical protein
MVGLDVEALGLHLSGGSRAVCTRDTHENDDLQAGGSARNVFIVFSAMMAKLGNQAMGASSPRKSLLFGERREEPHQRPKTSDIEAVFYLFLSLNITSGTSIMSPLEKVYYYAFALTGRNITC